MKLCGIFIIMILCIVLTGKKAASYKIRTNELNLVVLMFDYFESQIRYRAIPTSSIIEELSRQNTFSGLQLIADCAAMTSKGIAFPEAFEYCSLNSKGAFVSEERELLASFGRAIGQGDIESDIKHCKYHSTQFLQLLKEAREQEKIKFRMTTRLGILGAAAIFILLI